MEEIKTQIKEEINKVVYKLGGKSDILSIIGSWGDTMNDEETLENLKEYNKLTK